MTVMGCNLVTGATSHCGCKRVYTYRSRKPSLVTYNGEEVTVAQLAKQFGIPYDTLKGRLRRGLSVEDAIRKSGGE
jgi:nucleoside phosphorylase